MKMEPTTMGLYRIWGLEGMEKKMETTAMGLYRVWGLGFGRNPKGNGNNCKGYMETTGRIQSFIPS